MTPPKVEQNGTPAHVKLCALDGCARPARTRSPYCSPTHKERDKKRRQRADLALGQPAAQMVPKPRRRPKPIVLPAGYAEAVDAAALIATVSHELDGVDPEVVWAIRDEQDRFRHVARKSERSSRRRPPPKKPEWGYPT